MTRELDRIRFVTRHFNDLQGLRYWVPLGMITLSLGGTTYFENRPVALLRLGLFLGAILLAFGARRYYRRAFGEVEPAAPVPDIEAVPVYSPAGPPQRVEGYQAGRGMRHFAAVMGLTFLAFSICQAVTPIVQIEVDESLVQPPWRTLDESVVLYPEPPAAGHHLSTPSTTKATFGMSLYALYGAFFLGVWLWRERRPSQGYHLVLAVLLLGLAAFGTYLGSFLNVSGQAAKLVSFFLPAVAHLWIALLICGLSMIVAGLLDHWQLVRGLAGSGPVALEAQS